MTYYRSIVSKTLEVYLEFDESEFDGSGNDADEFAWEISRDIPMEDWNTINTEISTEEFDGELPELS